MALFFPAWEMLTVYELILQHCHNFTLTEQIRLLTGYTADPQFLNRVTWVSIQHDSRIEQIDTVRAYHFGNNYIVEVCIPQCITFQVYSYNESA